jgi:ABC-type branched-subunit amino acid transport system ATPase component
MTPPALEVKALGHRFGGLTVLSSVSFTVPEGAIAGLIGPNGSGKSTLFNILSGFLSPLAGVVSLHGRDLKTMSVEQRCRAGLVRTFQTPQVFEHMTVLENLMAGAYQLTRSGLVENMLALPRARRDLTQMRSQAEALAQRFGLDRLLGLPAGKLSGGQRRLLELVRGYAAKPKLLLLDEPSTGLNRQEIVQLGAWLAELNREGIALLLVSHDMQLMNIANVVHVLYFGEIIAAGTMAQMQQDPRVREAYLGA